jgi:hypothetical protein
LDGSVTQPGFAARTSNTSLPKEAVVRAANHVAAKKTKKKKDDEKTRKARLDRGEAALRVRERRG